MPQALHVCDCVCVRACMRARVCVCVARVCLCSSVHGRAYTCPSAHVHVCVCVHDHLFPHMRNDQMPLAQEKCWQIVKAGLQLALQKSGPGKPNLSNGCAHIWLHPMKTTNSTRVTTPTTTRMQLTTFTFSPIESSSLAHHLLITSRPHLPCL